MKVFTIQTESAGRQMSGRAEIDFFRHKPAMKRGLMCLGACWGIGALMLFLPWMQIFIPPLLFFTGIFVAFFVYFKTKTLPELMRGSTQCVHCGNETNFEFVNVRPPFYSGCETCRTGYRIMWPPERCSE